MFDKLFLREKMQESYLIQRLQKPLYFVRKDEEGNEIKIDNPFSFGGGLVNGGLSKEAMGLLREIFSFDYMGSAEFEFGAVPAALQFLAEQSEAKNLVTGVVESVYYLCPREYEKEVQKRISTFKNGLKGGRMPETKEHVGLRDYFDRDDAYSKKNLGWLEIDNGYAFFVDGEMFTKFCTILGVKVRISKVFYNRGGVLQRGWYWQLQWTGDETPAPVGPFATKEEAQMDFETEPEKKDA